VKNRALALSQGLWSWTGQRRNRLSIFTSRDAAYPLQPPEGQKK